MILALARLVVLGGIAAFVADRFLARRRPGDLEPVVSSVVVAAPIDATWAVLSDVARQPEWMDDLRAVRFVTPPPVGAGTRAEGTVRIMGMTVIDPVTITEFEPPRRFALRHEGRFSGHGLITLEPADDGRATLVRWEETLVAPLLPHLADVIARPVFATVFQRDLENLRRLVES